MNLLHLKEYRVKLHLEGPVFIGSGQRRTAKEFIHRPSFLYFPLMHKVYEKCQAFGKAQDFEKYMLDGPRESLGEWLTNNIPGEPPVSEWGKHFVMITGFDSVRSKKTGLLENPKINDVAEFIKDPYGNPYIPGSSLKGMLRTILLHVLITKSGGTQGRSIYEPAKHSRNGRFNRGASLRESKRLEQAFFNKLDKETSRNNAVTDIFQGLRVSDSTSLELTDLTLCQKIDVKPNGERNALPIFRECLKPGLEIEFQVVVDTRLGDSTIERFMDELDDYADTVYGNQFRDFNSKFQLNAHEYPGYDPAEYGPYVYLGGGAGFRSKTVVDDTLDVAEILDAQFRGKGHYSSARKNNHSPKVLKLTKFESKYFEFGKCKISVDAE